MNKTMIAPIVKEVAEFIIKNRTTNINKIQFEFNLSYDETQDIIKVLEDLKVISPIIGLNPREALIDVDQLDEFFSKL